jgi:hypothetical protein
MVNITGYIMPLIAAASYSSSRVTGILKFSDQLNFQGISLPLG